MLTDAQRRRNEERLRLEKLRQTSGAYDDAVIRAARQDTKSRKGRKQAKARKEVTESLERQARRREKMKKSQSSVQSRFTSDNIDYRKSGMTKNTVDNRKNT